MSALVSVSSHLLRAAETSFADGAVSADVVSDIRNRLIQPAAPVQHQEVVADLLAARSTHVPVS